MDRAAKKMVSTMDPAAINQALSALCAHSRAQLIGIFRQHKDVAVSIDGVTIKSRKFLNIEIVNPISDTLPLT
jgi:hypothetical protein